MEYEFFLVNAFTNAPYSGNGAGVCLLTSQQGEVSDTLKQKLATEINLSVTAYVTSSTGNVDFQTESRFGLQWFTPTTEIPMCGHATLATAAVFFYHLGNINPSITFDTLSGPLVVERGVEDHQIRMELPWRDTVTPFADDQFEQLVKATVGSLPVKEFRLSSAPKYPLIRLDDSVTREQFEKFNPDPAELLNAYDNIIGVIVTLKGSSTNGCVDDSGTVYDFVTRFFAPWVGLNEDPVCGSSNAVLGPYWAKVLDKKRLYACQCSKRKGELWVEVNEPGTTVAVMGQFFTYLRGHWKSFGQVMEYEFFLVNAFTNAPYSGNGAGVCLLTSQQGEVSDTLKQKLATEINLSETAFVTSYNENSDFQTESRFGLRWFTPTTEVPLCGHATLATAAVFFYHLGNINPSLTFDTLSGPLVVERGVEDHQIRMELPWRDTVTPSAEDHFEQLVKATVGSLPVREFRLSPAAKYPLIRLDDSVTREQFEKFNPVPADLLKACDNIIGVIVTLKGSSTNGCVNDSGTTYDFVTRFFAPWAGIDEDPVCGSANAVLSPYWANVLDKKKLYAFQCSKRKGELRLEVNEPGTTVAVMGQFFTYVRGHVRFQ